MSVINIILKYRIFPQFHSFSMLFILVRVYSKNNDLLVLLLTRTITFTTTSTSYKNKMYAETIVNKDT